MDPCGVFLFVCFLFFHFWWVLLLLCCCFMCFLVCVSGLFVFLNPRNIIFHRIDNINSFDILVYCSGWYIKIDVTEFTYYFGFVNVRWYQFSWISLTSWSTKLNVHLSAIFTNIWYLYNHWPRIFVSLKLNSTKIDTHEYYYHSNISMMMYTHIYWYNFMKCVRMQLGENPTFRQDRFIVSPPFWFYFV